MTLCENGKRVTVEVGSHGVFGGGVRGDGPNPVFSWNTLRFMVRRGVIERFEKAGKILS